MHDVESESMPLKPETTGIFEDNTKAIQNWKNYEHIQHKRKRCWVKEL